MKMLEVSNQGAALRPWLSSPLKKPPTVTARGDNSTISTPYSSRKPQKNSPITLLGCIKLSLIEALISSAGDGSAHRRYRAARLHGGTH
jgi:hypothetical protein